MSLHTIRFTIALALSVGLFLAAASQPASPSQDTGCATISTSGTGEPHAPPAHSVTASNGRPSLAWRNLLPGSFR